MSADVTDKVFYVGTTQLAPRVLSNTVLTNGVYRTLSKIDMGKATRKVWQDDRALLDGMRRRGSVFGAREDMTWTIMSQVNEGAVTAANIERVRDDEYQALLDLFLPDSGLLTLKATRYSYPSTAVSRVIYGEAGEVRAWQWQREGLDDGLVGKFSGPVCILTVPFVCPFPWWMDETATSTAELTLDGTARTTTITNTGHRPCGLKFNIEGSAAANLTVRVTNTTTGVDAGIAGSGVTLAGITLHATNGHVVDQFVDDPQRFQAYREADLSSIRDKVQANPRIWLQKGANTITFQIVAGTPAGTETIQFSHRNLWASP